MPCSHRWNEQFEADKGLHFFGIINKDVVLYSQLEKSRSSLQISGFEQYWEVYRFLPALNIGNSSGKIESPWWMEEYVGYWKIFRGQLYLQKMRFQGCWQAYLLDLALSYTNLILIQINMNQLRWLHVIWLPPDPSRLPFSCELGQILLSRYFNFIFCNVINNGYY